MHFSGERYYKLNQTLLTVLGLWPYNNSMFKWFHKIFIVLLLSFSIYLQLWKIITTASNLESATELLSFCVPCLIFFVKYVTFCIKSEHVKRLIDKMKFNWDIIKCKEEVEIFQQYANLSKLSTIFIAMIFYIVFLLFLTSQLLPKVLDLVVPLNESRPCETMAVIGLLLDQEKYFVLIFMHMTVALWVELTTLVATETMFLLYLQHCCALFKVASYRIEHAFDCELRISASKKDVRYYANIINAVIVHNRAIGYFDLLQSSFEVSYFILVVLGVLSLSINLFRFFQVGTARRIKEAFISLLLIFVHYFYMFLTTYTAQIMTNHSIDVYYKTCNLPWHSVSVRLQKMLQFIMQRSSIECKFDIGTIYDGSLQCFASLASTSLSYFTVFWSIQH